MISIGCSPRSLFESPIALSVARLVSGVCRSVVLGAAQVFGHLGTQRTLRQFLDDKFEQAVLTDEVPYAKSVEMSLWCGRVAPK